MTHITDEKGHNQAALKLTQPQLSYQRWQHRPQDRLTDVDTEQAGKEDIGLISQRALLVRHTTLIIA